MAAKRAPTRGAPTELTSHGGPFGRLWWAGSSAQSLRHQADSGRAPLVRVEKLHGPAGVLIKSAASAADEVAANLGHLDPGRILVGAFEGLIGATRISSLANSQKVLRHGGNHWVKPIWTPGRGPERRVGVAASIVALRLSYYLD